MSSEQPIDAEGSAKYYFQAPWPAFAWNGVTYDLSHLNEYVVEVEVDSKSGLRRCIAVTFGDHCFTRKPGAYDGTDLYYPASDRNPGCFCFVRYGCSKKIREHIAWAINGKVWTVDGDSLAIIRVIETDSSEVYYGIVFSLERVTGLPVQLRMRVKTAFVYDESIPITYGSVRFRHLVKLTLERKRVGRIVGSNRKWPQLEGE
jgi:hypothetical protein